MPSRNIHPLDSLRLTLFHQKSIFKSFDISTHMFPFLVINPDRWWKQVGTSGVHVTIDVDTIKHDYRLQLTDTIGQSASSQECSIRQSTTRIKIS